MTSSPLVLLVLFGVGLYVSRLWWNDFQAQRRGAPNPGALPGATSAPTSLIVVAALGGIVIVAAETWGEIRLGLTAEQSEMTVLLGGYTLVAAVVEEIIFRGFIVAPERKGRFVLWSSIIGASLLFAAVHPFLWQWENGAWTWSFTAKGWFSTGAVFVSSLWFYTVRFLPANRTRSLLPCFASHAAKNLAVFAIKAAQGFVSGWV